MHGINKITSVQDPGPLKVSGKLELLHNYGLYIGLVIIAVCAGINYLMGPDHIRLFWKVYLVTCVFFMGFAIYGIIFVGIQTAVSSVWSTSIRRVAEGFTAYLIPGFVSVAILGVFGSQYIYDWHIAEIRHGWDGLKLWFFSYWGFATKLILFFGWMYFLGAKLVKWSLEQDKTGDINLSTKARKLSVPFMFVFAYVYTFYVCDMLLAINSKWFSTMFGVYCFAGTWLSGHCLLGITTVNFQANGYLNDAVKKHNLKDLGTWIMGFSCFMMYIGFSQFMLIWYANMPAETFFFMARSEGGWQYLFMLLPILKWIVPFVFMMPWGNRNNPKSFKIVGSLVLLGQYLDIYWMVMPGESAPSLTIWLELLMLIGFFSIFAYYVLRFYTKNSIYAFRDPKILTSINGEYV